MPIFFLALALYVRLSVNFRERNKVLDTTIEYDNVHLWLKIHEMKRFVIPLQITICYCRMAGMIGQVGQLWGFLKKGIV
jgi:hypothetical protein